MISKNHKSRIRRIILVVIFLNFGTLIILTSVTSVQAENKKLNILFISSFTKDTPAQTAFEVGLDNALGYNEGNHNLFFEFMDIPRLNENNFKGIFATLLEEKYHGTELGAEGDIIFNQ